MKKFKKEECFKGDLCEWKEIEKYGFKIKSKIMKVDQIK